MLKIYYCLSLNSAKVYYKDEDWVECRLPRLKMIASTKWMLLRIHYTAENIHGL